jgi:hypothetical protein
MFPEASVPSTTENAIDHCISSVQLSFAVTANQPIQLLEHSGNKVNNKAG